jgi:putative addiction module component (TIGR02574 family)
VSLSVRFAAFKASRRRSQARGLDLRRRDLWLPANKAPEQVRTFLIVSSQAHRVTYQVEVFKRAAKFEPLVALSSGFASCHTGFMAKRAVDIGHLSTEERLALIEELWESLDSDERDAIPLTPEQEAELDRRLEAYERDGPVGISAEELHEKLRRRRS